MASSSLPEVELAAGKTPELQMDAAEQAATGSVQLETMMETMRLPEAKEVEEASDEDAAAVEEEEEDVEKQIQRWKEQERQNHEFRHKIYLEDKKRLDQENEKERILMEKRSTKKQNKKRRKKKTAPKATQEQPAAKTVVELEPAAAGRKAEDSTANYDADEPAASGRKAEESAADYDAELPTNEEDKEEMWYLAKEARYLKQAAEMRSIGEYMFAEYLEKAARDARNTPWEADADPNAYQARLYRDNWDKNFGEYGPFDKTTSIPPSCFTEDYNYPFVSTQETLQLFSIKVGEIDKPLEWPLDVFGLVAVRDVVDRNRNMVFHRKRDNCQTITQKDPYLTLTGPTRAVVASVHPTEIEVDLKVKGSTESEDKDLSFLVVSSFNNGPCYRAERSKLSTLGLTYFRIDNSVEAAISVKIKSGSWPCGFRGLFTASTASLKRMKVVLLALEGDELPIDRDDKIELSRSIMCVEHQPKAKLTVSVQALNITVEEDVLRGDQFFTPKQAGTSIEDLKVGSVVMEVTVKWSLLSTFKSAYDALLEKRREA